MLFCLKTRVILWCCFSVCISQEIETWDHKTERWEDFHIRHCGMVCDNGTFVNLHGNLLCSFPRCFKCDCNSTCTILDTCCPYGFLQPGGTFLRQKREPKRYNASPPYREQVRCEPIPLNRNSYLQVVSCPTNHTSTSYIDSFRSRMQELCDRDSDEALDFDSFVSYVDIENGLVFKNKYCALCNGYEINSNISESTTSTKETERKLAVPWTMQVECFHFQEFYKLTSKLDFVKKARSNPISSECHVSYKDAPSLRQPRECFKNPPENYDVYSSSCDEPTLNMCRSLNNTSFTVDGSKNIFCAMCKGPQPALVNSTLPCDAFSETQAITIFSPLSLLLGSPKPGKAVEITQQNKCESKIEWMNDAVSAGMVKAIKTDPTSLY